MRIIAGRFKGNRIHVTGKRGVRPTTERVREALFSSLGDTVAGSRVLELFAGSGAYGFEALSRGAESVLFVEKDRKQAPALQRTAISLGVEDAVQILVLDAFKALSKLCVSDEKFDIVFCDPPYRQELVIKLLSTPWLTDLLTSDGVLILEAEAGLTELEIPAGLTNRFAKKYGDTAIRILQKK